MTMSGDSPDPEVFDEYWRTVWRPEPLPLTKRQFQWMLELLSDRHYERVLEIGCGEGTFARLLSPLAGSVVGIDVSPEAIGRARQEPVEGIEFRLGDVMQFPFREQGPWDLIVMIETIPYLGWRQTFYDLARLARDIFAATRSGGRLLVGNVQWGFGERGLYPPWTISAYHDLFRHAGFEPQLERRFVDDDEQFGRTEFLLSFFGREEDPWHQQG
jgi:SAM-dependent methyltransferase